MQCGNTIDHGLSYLFRNARLPGLKSTHQHGMSELIAAVLGEQTRAVKWDETKNF